MIIYKKIFLLIFLTGYTSLLSQSLRLGLNFPFRSPETASIANYMNRLQGCGAQIYRQLTYADLIWRHIEPTDNNWHFDYPDSVFFNYPQFEYVANLYSLTIADTNNGNVGFQVPWRACFGNPSCGWHYHLDSIATIDYLTTCINRYHNEVKYWELGNETQNGTYPLGIPNLPFLDFVKHNYRWIKSINPQMKVLLPGSVGTYGFPIQISFNWFHFLFSNDIGNYIDIFSIHDYNSWWTTPIHIDSILAIRDYYGLQSKEIWITESAVSSLNYSFITPPYSSVDEQAADVWRRSTIAWAKGINTFFWHSGWSSGPPSEWAEFGLLNHLGIKKKSYHSYKLLAEKISGFTTAEILSLGVVDDNNTSSTGGNGVWIMKFVVNGENKYVMWSRNNQTFQLTPVSDTKYFITHTVPSSISEDGETAIFLKDSVYVSAGNSYTFNLSSLPILVEADITTSVPFLTEENVLTEKEVVKIFPVPANSFIEFRNKLNASFHLDLFDVLGRLIQSLELNPLENKKIATDRFVRGIYFYRISNSKIALQQGKIIIK